MQKRYMWAALLGAINLPWVILWWQFSGPSQDRGPSLTALYMILVICTVCMVILPMFLGGIEGKRWLLILILGATNLFWCLRWLEIFADSTPPGLTYAAARREIVMYMALSSLLVLLVYRFVAHLLRQLARRRNAFSK